MPPSGALLKGASSSRPSKRWPLPTTMTYLFSLPFPFNLLLIPSRSGRFRLDRAFDPFPLFLKPLFSSPPLTKFWGGRKKIEIFYTAGLAWNSDAARCKGDDKNGKRR